MQQHAQVLVLQVMFLLIFGGRSNRERKNSTALATLIKVKTTFYSREDTAIYALCHLSCFIWWILPCSLLKPDHKSLLLQWKYSAF